MTPRAACGAMPSCAVQPVAMPSLFITGTDTEIGKSLAASALVFAYAALGLRAAAMKPIAAGAVRRDGRLINDDVEQLAAASNVLLPLELTTPYLFEEPAAPHIVAAAAGVRFDLAHIAACYAQVAAAAEVVVVEGVGGFRVPLDDRLDTADLAVALGLPVILVVGLRLGCINHALLSAAAIHASGLRLAGWIANCIDPLMTHREANIATLEQRFARDYQTPLLGVVPYLAAPTAAEAAAHLDLRLLTIPAPGNFDLPAPDPYSSI